jgi:group II intron reverse transcriptase/maturase
VRENRGCAGCDGVTLAGFQGICPGALDQLADEVLAESYVAWPLREVAIEKTPGSLERRILCVPAVRDRVLQTAAAATLDRLLEPEWEDSSFAYRRGRGVRQAVERVHALFHEGYRWVLDADIEGFFDNVNHTLVLDRLRPFVADELLLRLTTLWLDHLRWDGAELRRPGLGLPQGMTLSPLLANLFLDELDEAVEHAGLRMVRYADDFVVLTRSRKEAEQAEEVAAQTLERLQLHLHPGKTRILRGGDGLRFLGVYFLNDLLLQPLPGSKLQRKVLASAPPLPEHFWPQSERRPLRHYRAW